MFAVVEYIYDCFGVIQEENVIEVGDDLTTSVTMAVAVADHVVDYGRERIA